MEITGFSWKEDREWLLANGLGGYASSTLIGLNTRKYHGLLVAAFAPGDRRVMLSKINEAVVVGGKTYPLSTNQYWDNVDPDGYKYLKGFSLNPQPHFTYEVPGARVEKTLYMPHGTNAVLVEYNVVPEKGVRGVNFNADLITTSRDYHWVLHNPEWDFSFNNYGDVATLIPTHDNPPSICVGAFGGVITKPPYGDNRHRGLFYRKELERGYPCVDDLFIGARLESSVPEQKRIMLVCSSDLFEKVAIDTCRKILAAPSIYKEKERARKHELAKRFCSMNGLTQTEGLSNLVISSDEFVIREKTRPAIAAGYPWFGEWGRDSMISLPGLCLAAGRKREAEEMLIGMLVEAQNGLVPNTFSNGKTFNSADASLWLVWAVWKYLKYTNDYDFVSKRLWMDIKKLMKAYASSLDADFLVKWDSLQPMTWMDAVVDGVPVTLRKGKAVEIQALWYNALMVCAKLAEKLSEKPDPYLKMAVECRTSFHDKFINHDNGYLYDVVDGDSRDASVRPNALLAVSMSFPILDESRWKNVVDIAVNELLTPFGLRTLSSSDSRYRGFASGTQKECDLSYHQGDAWPWLLGPFIDAHAKTYPKSRIGQFLKPLLEAQAGCIGHIAEVYDGAPPHKPGGCMSQAWSVAEIMRVLAEYQDRL